MLNDNEMLYFLCLSSARRELKEQIVTLKNENTSETNLQLLKIFIEEYLETEKEYQKMKKEMKSNE